MVTLRSTKLTADAKDKSIEATHQLPIKHAHHESLAIIQDDRRSLGDLIEITDPEMALNILLVEQL
ncbi:hypothetical protein BGZ65_012070, partial [Modicella reniformis]